MHLRISRKQAGHMPEDELDSLVYSTSAGAEREPFSGPISSQGDDYLYACRRWSARDRWAARRWYRQRTIWVRGHCRVWQPKDPARPDFDRMLSAAERVANRRAVVIAVDLTEEYDDAVVEEALSRLLDRLYGLPDPGPAEKPKLGSLGCVY